MHGIFDTPREDMTPEGMVVLYYDPNSDRTGAASNLSYSMATHPVAWLLGTFAAGWAGGYLAWVAIGRYQAKKEMATTSSPIWKKNRKLPPFDPSKDSFASQQKYMPRNKRINKKWWE